MDEKILTNINRVYAISKNCWIYNYYLNYFSYYRNNFSQKNSNLFFRENDKEKLMYKRH